MQTTTEPNTAPDAKIIRRIKKLFALASSPNEHEAALALERAQELLLRYNLTLSSLAFEDQDPDAFLPVDQFVLDTSKQQEPWKHRLICTIARCNFCKGYRSATQANRAGSHGRKTTTYEYVVIGRPSNVRAVSTMYAWLVMVIENHAREENAKWRRIRQYAGEAVSDETSRAYSSSFKLGMACRIAERLEERHKAMRSQGMEDGKGGLIPALVLVSAQDKAVEEIKQWARDNGLSFEATRMRVAHERGKAAGMAAGSGVALGGELARGSRALGSGR